MRVRLASFCSDKSFCHSAIVSALGSRSGFHVLWAKLESVSLMFTNWTSLA